MSKSCGGGGTSDCRGDAWLPGFHHPPTTRSLACDPANAKDLNRASWPWAQPISLDESWRGGRSGLFTRSDPALHRLMLLLDPHAPPANLAGNKVGGC